MRVIALVKRRDIECSEAMGLHGGVGARHAESLVTQARRKRANDRLTLLAFRYALSAKVCTTSSSRSTSRTVLASPTDARIAPTAVSRPMHWEKRAIVKGAFPRDVPRKHSNVRARSNAKARSAAPGLQKHPPRTATRASRARSSTAGKATGNPRLSSTLNATV